MRPGLRESCLKHALFFSLLLAAGAAFAAEDYPAKPIQMIVPFPAGGPADIVGRLYAQHLSALVGQPVVTLNRDGASGSIGTAAAARAAPDGYTLVFGTTSTMVVNPLVMKQVPYDFWKDFALIGLIANAPHILAVREGLPAKSATELVAMAKRDPGKYTIASAGTGTICRWRRSSSSTRPAPTSSSCRSRADSRRRSRCSRARST